MSKEDKDKPLKSPTCIRCAERAGYYPAVRLTTWIDECENCSVSQQVSHTNDWKKRVAR